VTWWCLIQGWFQNGKERKSEGKKKGNAAKNEAMVFYSKIPLDRYILWPLLGNNHRITMRPIWSLKFGDPVSTAPRLSRPNLAHKSFHQYILLLLQGEKPPTKYCNFNTDFPMLPYRSWPNIAWDSIHTDDGLCSYAKFHLNGFIVLASGGKKAVWGNFDIWGALYWPHPQLQMRPKFGMLW